MVRIMSEPNSLRDALIAAFAKDQNGYSDPEGKYAHPEWLADLALSVMKDWAMGDTLPTPSSASGE